MSSLTHIHIVAERTTCLPLGMIPYMLLTEFMFLSSGAFHYTLPKVP